MELLEQAGIVGILRAGAFVVDPEVEPPPSAAACAPIVIVLSAGPNLLAFASRFTSTCVSRCWSPRITGTSSASASATFWRRCSSNGPIKSRAAPITSSNSTSCLRMPSWPASIRTLSSRLSISHVNRCVPRCSDDTSWRCPPSSIVPMPSLRSSIEASCAASGVRNSCEMLASTVSRVRRTASSSVSSRSTCTWMPSAGAALAITTRRTLSSGPGTTCSTARAEPSRRAWTIGHAYSHGRRPLASRRRTSARRRRTRRSPGSRRL